MLDFCLIPTIMIVYMGIRNSVTAFRNSEPQRKSIQFFNEKILIFMEFYLTMILSKSFAIRDLKSEIRMGGRT